MQHVEAHWNPVLGVVCGVVATLAFPLTSLLGRMISEDLRPNEIQTLLRETLPVSVAYFVLANLVVFLTARLFGGRGSLFRYQIAVISVTLGLSYRRALAVFLILGLPLFLIYDQVL